MKNLDRDDALQLGVIGAVHNAHPPRPHSPEARVATKHRSAAKDRTSVHTPRPLAIPKRALVCLKVLRGGEGLVAIGRNTIVGREAAGAAVLHGQGLSRMHARFMRKLDGSITVVDAGSTNGVFVDGQRVEAATLREGSVIQLGADVVLLLEFRHLAPDIEQSRLTPREQEVALLASTGMSDEAIAQELDVARRTVTTHVSRLLSKLGVANRLELIRRASGLGP